MSSFEIRRFVKHTLHSLLHAGIIKTFFLIRKSKSRRWQIIAKWCCSGTHDWFYLTSCFIISSSCAVVPCVLPDCMQSDCFYQGRTNHLFESLVFMININVMAKWFLSNRYIKRGLKVILSQSYMLKLLYSYSTCTKRCTFYHNVARGSLGSAKIYQLLNRTGY